MNSLIATLDLYFGKKAPQLPHGFKEFLVKIAPYIVIIGLIFFAFALIPMIFITFGASTFMGMMGTYGRYAMGPTGMGISFVIFLAIEILYLMAVRGLFKRSMKSWTLVFYACLLGGLDNLLHGNVIGLIIGLLIGFYFLFQLRPLYNGVVPASAQNTSPSTPPSTPPASPTSTA